MTCSYCRYCSYWLVYVLSFVYVHYDVSYMLFVIGCFCFVLILFAFILLYNSILKLQLCGCILARFTGAPRQGMHNAVLRRARNGHARR